ncbi:MAG: hypothetical protein ACOCWO_03575, partial [Candidatus Muiribacteriaceae bacterium]
MDLHIEEFGSLGFDLTVEEFSSLNSLVGYFTKSKNIDLNHFENFFLLEEWVKSTIRQFVQDPLVIHKKEPGFHSDYTEYFFTHIPDLFPLNNPNKKMFIRSSCLGKPVCDGKTVTSLAENLDECCNDGPIKVYYLDEWLVGVYSEIITPTIIEHSDNASDKIRKISADIDDINHKITVTREQIRVIADKRDRKIDDILFITEKLKDSKGESGEDLSGICAPIPGMLNQINHDGHKIAEYSETIRKLEDVIASKNSILEEYEKKKALSNLKGECDFLLRSVMGKKDFNLENHSFLTDSMKHQSFYNKGYIESQISDISSVISEVCKVRYKGVAIGVDISVVMIPFSGFSPECVFISDVKEQKSLRAVIISPLFGESEPEEIYRALVGEAFWACAKLEYDMCVEKHCLFDSYADIHKNELKINKAKRYNIKSAFSFDLYDWITRESRGECVMSQQKRE